jgi:TonB family protein
MRGNDVWYAPDVYDDETPGLTRPDLVKEGKPNYTAEAMRARTEGIVRLECIIEVDGSVGPIRVRHSLDAVNGLDDEAIKTVRRWRFKPGMMDGVPVRTRVGIEISFLLRDSGYRPELGWPEDFNVRRSQPEKAGDQFAGETLMFADTRINIKYPRDWAVVKAVSNGQLITVQRVSEREARGCTLLTPKSSEMDLMVPVRNEALHAFEKSLRAEIANGPGGIELKRVGQIAAGHLWIWSEMWRRGIDTSSVQSANTGQLQSTFDGTRVWRFTTTDSRQELNVICYVLTPSRASADAMKEQLRHAGDDFAGILTDIAVRPR